MGRTRRKKKRTQDPTQDNAGALPGDKIPKSFVFSRGKLPALLRNLEKDLRKVMMPHTALNLRESKRNSMKDFVHVAAPLGVTHFMILSNTKTSPYLRLARSPHGPTLTFKIHAYSLAADVARAQTRPRAPPAIFKSPPLVVMNGLTTGEEHLKLIAVVFQNIVPPINVNTVKLSNCQRFLLLNYDKTTKCIDFRHYSVSAQPVGVSRNIRKLVQRKKLPDLSKLSDVSEFVNKTGYGSESEAEDEASKVELADDFGKGNHASQRSAVKLHEIGPRMTLQLVKVEEGLCDGAVMFHEYVKKTEEEILALRNSKEQREALRKQRRAEQEANVKRKEEERNSKKKRKFVESTDKPEEDYDVVADDEAEMSPDEGPVGGGGVENDDMEDADWYRKEVGEEPDEGFLAGQTHNRRPPSKYNSNFSKRREKGEDRKERPIRTDKGSNRSSEKRVDRKPGGNFGKSFGRGSGSSKKFSDKSDKLRGKSRSRNQKGEGQDKFSRNRSSGRGDKDGRPSKKRKH